MNFCKLTILSWKPPVSIFHLQNGFYPSDILFSDQTTCIHIKQLAMSSKIRQDLYTLEEAHTQDYELGPLLV